MTNWRKLASEMREQFKIKSDAELLAWLLRLPAKQAQAYFCKYSISRERKKAMRRDYQKEQP